MREREDKKAEIVLIVEVIGVWEGGEGGAYGQIIKINVLVTKVIHKIKTKNDLAPLLKI